MSHEDFDINGLATHLHLTRDQVLRLVERGKLPGRRIAGQWRFARAEVHLPDNPEEQVQLADDWWERSEREREKSGLRKEMQLRAVHWYLTAMPRLPAGLLQVKAEVRIKDAEKAHGKEAVEPIRKALGGRVAAGL